MKALVYFKKKVIEPSCSERTVFDSRFNFSFCISVLGQRVVETWRVSVKLRETDFSMVLDPIKTTIILSAAVQEGFLRWGKGLDRGFRVATGETGVFGVLRWVGKRTRKSAPFSFFFVYECL